MDAIGKKTILRVQAEIADTPIKRSQGLMGRKFLPSNSGMLFDFGNAQPLSFWMYNTYIPLQIAFIEKDGRIGQIENLVPLSTRRVRSKDYYRYALELPSGWFDKNNIKVGAMVGLEPLINPDQQVESPQSAESYDVEIVASYKDILRRADEKDVPLTIEYVTDEGLDIVPALIEPPFDFLSTKDGDPDGRVLVWNFQNITYENEKFVPKTPSTGRKSYIIENIKAIRDATNQMNITNAWQVDQLAKQKGVSKRDEFRAKGIMTGLNE